MKVLIGQFINEANANIPVKDEITTFDIAFGDELIEKMQVGDIFEQAGIEIIPSVYAVSGASGVIKRHTFDYIEACFLNAVREHLHEIDGIYLMLHGASEVDGLGSGDHHILKAIRDLVGPRTSRSRWPAIRMATCVRTMLKRRPRSAATASLRTPIPAIHGGRWRRWSAIWSRTGRTFILCTASCR